MQPEALKTAMGVFRPDLYDAALGQPGKASGPSDACWRVCRGLPLIRLTSPGIWRRSRLVIGKP